MSYGFVRILSKTAESLGIERDEYETTGWIRICYVDFLRFYKNEIDERGRIRQRLHVRVKEPDGDWIPLDPADLYGEKALMNGRKVYKLIGED